MAVTRSYREAGPGRKAAETRMPSLRTGGDPSKQVVLLDVDHGAFDLAWRVGRERLRLVSDFLCDRCRTRFLRTRRYCKGGHDQEACNQNRNCRSYGKDVT